MIGYTSPYDPRVVERAKGNERMRALFRRVLDNYGDELSFEAVLKFLAIEARDRQAVELLPSIYTALNVAKALGL